MTLNGWLQIALYCALVLVFVKPLGCVHGAALRGERPSSRPCSGRSNAAPTPGRYQPGREQHWTTYSVAMLVFNGVGLPRSLRPAAAAGAAAQPQGFGAGRADLAFNTAVSFVTNTNWQSYGGEIDPELFRPAGRAHRPELRLGGHRHCARHRSGRGASRAGGETIGNFWADMTRATLYILLPLCLVIALALFATRRAAEPRRLCEATRSKAAADDRPGARRLAGRHQAARHQWRRVLQRQLGPSVREPDASDEPGRDARRSCIPAA